MNKKVFSYGFVKFEQLKLSFFSVVNIHEEILNSKLKVIFYCFKEVVDQGFDIKCITQILKFPG